MCFRVSVKAVRSALTFAARASTTSAVPEGLKGDHIPDHRGSAEPQSLSMGHMLEENAEHINCYAHDGSFFAVAPARVAVDAIDRSTLDYDHYF